MRIAYNLISPPVWNITGGFIADTTMLTDRSPASYVLLGWPAGGQTTSTTVTLTGAFPTQTLIAGALLGTGLPVGLKVEVKGKRPTDIGHTYNLGGNSQTAKVAKQRGGGTGVSWWFDETMDQIESVQVTLYNDVGGSTSIAPSAVIKLGELALGGGAVGSVDQGYTLTHKINTKVSRTLAAQADVVSSPGYRELGVSPVALGDDEMWQDTMQALREDPYCLCIVLDSKVNQALFGLCVSIPVRTGKPCNYYDYDVLKIEEVPASP